MKIVAIFAAIVCVVADAKADVIANSNFTLVPDTIIVGAQYRFTAFQNQIGTDPTSLWVSVNNQTLVPVGWNIDEEADYYLVPNLANFSAATITQGLFAPLFVLDHSTPVNIGFGDFYLGINTGQGFIGPGQPNRDVFGWVHLRNDAVTGLTMLGNAMSYGGQGIIVGTTTAIPEPAISLLTGLGLCLLIASRCWRVRYVSLKQGVSERGGRTKEEDSYGCVLEGEREAEVHSAAN